MSRSASVQPTAARQSVDRATASTVENKTIIDGVCYDLTKFMDTHPGEKEEGHTGMSMAIAPRALE